MKKQVLLFLISFISLIVGAKQIQFASEDLFKTNYFIENKGQFDLLQHHVKNVDFAIIQQHQEIYFTPTAYHFHLLAQKENPDSIVGNWVSINWLNSNAKATKILSKKTSHYYTYGLEQYNSFGYESVRYNNIYPGIDIEYRTHPKGGVEYILYLAKHADLQQVKFQYKSLEKLDVKISTYGLTITNDIANITESNLKAFYEDGTPVNIYYVDKGNYIGLASNEKINKNKKLIIDPWVNSISTLNGITATVSNMGYDVDFDSFGNLFVLGGGGGVNSLGNAPKIAKYSSVGTLLWTFSGNIVAPIWNSSPEIIAGSNGAVGNFVVDKLSSKIYVGQGFSSIGSKIIRLNSNGNYDNLISTPNNQVQHIWEMKFNCTNGRVIAMGGSPNSNLNFGVIDTTSGIVSTSCITGANGYNQQIVCSTLDLNGEVYFIFASNGTPIIDNKIYKLNNTFSAQLWNTPSGFGIFQQGDNKIYTGLASFSNGFNCLSVNNTYLYYYDGINLKAFDKISGSPVGTPIVIPNHVARMQGGVYANNCNEVFIGGNNGNILRYGFNGNSFTLQNTINIPGQLGKAIYDINFNPINNLLYVTGNGFVAAVDQSSTCSIAPSGNINLSQTIVCPDSAFINITNPDPNTSYTFIWTDSTTNTPIQTSVMPVGINGHGISGLITGHTYKVTVLKPSSCQIISNNTSFIFSCGVINISLCPGQSYTLSNNTVISTPGIYTDTLLNSINQDSIIYINLVNYPIYHDSVYASICAGSSYLLPSGISTNTAGIYNSNLTSSHGCDSIITTFLGLSSSTTSSVSLTRCSDNPYTLPNNKIVTTSGIYIDTITNSTGCDSIITTELFFTQKPSLYIGKDTELCNGSSITIDISQPNSTFLWNDNSTFSKRTIDTKGIYIASITTAPCQAVYDTITITACKCDVFIPNAFSPNDDGKNDNFRPYFKCITPPENYILKIYNRWGKEIFFTKLQDDSWDGTYRFSPQDAGNYKYYLKYIDPQTNVETTYTGDITLLR